jgi:hypothetical protein
MIVREGADQAAGVVRARAAGRAVSLVSVLTQRAGAVRCRPDGCSRCHHAGH